MVQITRRDGATYEAHAKFAEVAENGVRGLASEFLASRLAALLNANIPPAEVVDLEPGMVIALGDGSTPAPGVAVALQTIEPAVDVNATDALLDIPGDRLALLSVVQWWTEVGDRGHNMIRSRNQIYSIDFASAFGPAWGGSTVMPALVDDPLLVARLASEAPAMRTAADQLERVTDTNIDIAVGEVPDEWMNSGERGGFCARLKASRQVIADQIRAKYPAP